MRLDLPIVCMLVISCGNSQATAKAGDSQRDDQQTEALTAVPAFPGAEGHGAYSRGGRGGRVIEVTNLLDRGPGSLRAALESPGPRIVVFRINGIIELKDAIRIKHPFLTVAGQTAPGSGITITGVDNPLIRIRKGAHDIVIRHLRLRNGSGVADGDGHDCLVIESGSNILIDHVSFSWSTDENVSIWRKLDDDPVENVTIQRSIIAEGLAGHSTGLIIGGQVTTDERGQLVESWKEIRDITVHHNLFVHNGHRNPRITSIGTQFINNVIYNWKLRIGSTTSGAVVDITNNYAKAGPMSKVNSRFFHQSKGPPGVKAPDYEPSILIEGNIVSPGFPDPAADNWVLFGLDYSDRPVPLRFRRVVELPPARMPVSRETAVDAYESVLLDVGANARLDCDGGWIANQDEVDARYIADVREDRGPRQPIKSAMDAGGHAAVVPGSPCADHDEDGMPDEWEERFGLNPSDPSDGALDADRDGYTNVEEYLNGTSPR